MTAADQPPMIDAQGLTKRYGGATVVDALTLAVRAGAVPVPIDGGG